ncbi:MAG: 6-carboxytetrahydropterin synthase QueD [Chitinophagales bacterium]|nr:6-carboxytetrahydropterin synthase QueD [Chitinophagales bacterium]
MRIVEVYKEFTFDSAHYLPNVPDDHKCKNLHGHTYRVRVYVKGSIDEDLGWVVDFSDVKKAFEPFEKQLDHKLLNDIEGLENPTAEMIAVWLWDKLIIKLPNLSKIEVAETPTSGVIITKD